MKTHRNYMTTINFKNEEDKWNYLPYWPAYGKDLKRVTYQHEVGDSGNNHWQCFIELKNSRSWNEVRERVMKRYKIKIHVSEDRPLKAHPARGKAYIGMKGKKTIGEKFDWKVGEKQLEYSEKKKLAHNCILYWNSLSLAPSKEQIMEGIRKNIEYCKSVLK